MLPCDQLAQIVYQEQKTNWSCQFPLRPHPSQSHGLPPFLEETQSHSFHT